MSIIIRNITQRPTSAGPNEYELRINSQVICHFTHNRESGLSACLETAAKAAEATRWKHIADLLNAINGERP
jgi:hypothetical protein